MKLGRLCDGILKATFALLCMFYFAEPKQSILDASDWRKLKIVAHVICAKLSPHHSFCCALDVRMAAYETAQKMVDHTVERFQELERVADACLSALEQRSKRLPEQQRQRLLRLCSVASVKATGGDGAATEVNRHTRLNEQGHTVGCGCGKCCMHGHDLIAGAISQLGRGRRGTHACIVLDDALAGLARSAEWPAELVRFTPL